ncbi:ATP-binding protein [Streptomyces sp. x-80]|jgi:anti-sigma regulatory factor (Ser/Thr protein kinase)|uniref:ATP-binding protein n=1 Tax=Streptomyces sp. x-80 TaxID=2789282 RepID=UPI0039807FB3
MTTHPAETVHDALREGRCDDAWWIPGPNGFAACALSRSARTVADARRFTRSTLEGWQVCAAVADDTALVVSELVSNALRHGARRGADDAATAVRSGAVCPAWLALTRRDATVLCAVSDPGSSAPVVRSFDKLTESGRGLHIVDRLSESWGWTPPDGSGKTVWATVSTRG